MPNPYKNKVVYGNQVLIDLTDTTAEAADVAAGKYFHDKTGARVEGTAVGGAISVVETEDSHGGTIVEITGEAVKLQSKTVTPSTSQQVISPDTGYTGMSQITVNAIPAGSASTPATTITANPSISVNGSTGLITATASASKNVTPTVSEGYVSSGTAGTIAVSGSNTSQLNVQAATTITPTKSSQVAVAAGKYTTGAVTVAAIPAAYQDVTQVDAMAGDVVSGKKFVNSSGTVVNGTLTFQTYYTGSSDPSSSLGVNGDIYLKTT